MSNLDASAQPPKATVLLVDDDKLILATFRYALEKKGYRVLLAENGSAALKLIENNAPDVVFLDVLMPVKEGLETLMEIKKRFPAIPVHVMSGGGVSGKHDFLDTAMKFGAAGTIRKPVTPQALIAVIEGVRKGADGGNGQKVS